MSSPLLMPPCTPPELFVTVRILPARISNASLCCEPCTRVAANPEPISNAFAAGMLSIAFASSASSLSNTGSPSPGGMPRDTLDYAADGVACLPNLLDQRDHLFCSGTIRAADNILLHVVHRDGGTVNLRSHFVDLSHVSHEFEVRVQGGQCFFGNRTRRDAT